MSCPPLFLIANAFLDFSRFLVVFTSDDLWVGKEKSREIKEAMEIRKRWNKTLNREEGTYLLSHVYDPLLRTGNKTIQSIRTGNKTNQSNRKSTTTNSRESDQMTRSEEVLRCDGRI